MNEEINGLRAAAQATPNNYALRKVLVQTLIRYERWEEAEVELKSVLKLFPDKIELKILLAEVFHQQGKTGIALVVIEELLDSPTPPPQVWLLDAKLKLASQQIDEARDAYERAIALDPSLKDTFLESEINLAKQKDLQPEREKLRIGGIENEDDFDHAADKDIERPKIKFEDVGGMESVKEEINLKIIAPLKFPDLYKAYGKEIGGGILLYGPPGCGKTYLARATAGEVQANFLYVGISDILDMYVGSSEQKLHAIFEKARRLKPCVLFFDEVDALAASRTDLRQSAAKNVINQFLYELDGPYSNDGVLILGATNAPWHLDNAFRRGGRFSRVIFVPPPEQTGREAILEILLKDKPTDGKIDIKKLAKRTSKFSGADLKNIIEMAVESKLEMAMKQGKLLPLETSDLLHAIKKQKPTTTDWFASAKNYALFANEAGLYDEILEYIKKNR